MILRPLRRDMLRTALTVIAVALGIAVVIAIDLAGNAAAGSFESSMVTVVGKTDLEIHANGGIDEQWIGRLSALPVNARFAPGLDTTVKIDSAGYVNLFGIDAIAESKVRSSASKSNCGDDAPAYVTERLAHRLPKRFLINGRWFCIARTVPSLRSDFIAADIADVQQTLGRFGKLDRIDVFLDKGVDLDSLEHTLRSTLPSGYRITRPGARSQENQKMLGAFRWNLRILSYIALVVGAFLIYNTISISVVRRRSEIGILRALGVSRRSIFFLFILEAAMLGVAGSALGLLLGRALAGSMVALIAQTVRSLYTSSSPAPVHLTILSIALAFVAGLAASLISAWGPAREAMQVVPAEAMGRGSRETRSRLRLGRNSAIALVLALLAWIASLPGPIEGRPVFGYLATLLSVAAAALLAPLVVLAVNRAFRTPLQKWLGAEGLLASRGLQASIGRTSVVVAALATAIAMMASVGIMVGSFRETVLVWLDSQLRADLYIRAIGPAVAGESPPLSPEIPKILQSIPGVADVDVFSAIEFTYQGQRATLGAGNLDVQRRYSRLNFQSGDHDAILRSLPNADRAIVSEPFAEKHNVHVGDRLSLPIGSSVATVTVMAIYFEYSSEQGYVILDRTTLLRYLPNQPPTNIAVYTKPGADVAKIRREIETRTTAFPVSVAPNADLRREAVIIFDRTFAITWALEGVAIIVAMLGAANALLALVLDRRRELGMLRYLGAASSQIRRMILVEAGLLGLFALLLGAALGLVLSLLLIYVINKQSFGWTIQFHFPALALGGAMLLIWAVTILSGLYPAHVAARLKPIEVIHEE